MNVMDINIKKDIRNLFHADSRLNFSDIHVNVKDKVVTLSGYAFNNMAKTAARMDAMKVSEVQKVRDEIKTTYPPETSKSVDEDIKTNILDLLGTISKINSEFLDVQVADGIVVLEGTVNSFLKKNQIEEAIIENAFVLDIVNKIKIKQRK
jgi:hyperosmotically inducible protein